MNNEKVNMHYRFTSNSEPTEQQLAVLMSEVGNEVRKKSKKNASRLLEKIDDEFQKAKAYYANL